MTDYSANVSRMLGEVGNVPASTDAWRDIEEWIGLALPSDYKNFIESYAPMIVNGHLYIHHPESSRWNLRDWMISTVRAYEDVDEWDEVTCESLLSGGWEFGTSDGLIPILESNRGECFFLRRGDEGSPWKVYVFVGADADFYEYRMGFSEWLYRYLIGEDVAGPNSSAFYPGPVQLQRRSTSLTAPRPEPFFGPDRGM